jgi:hypothetical protein
VFSDDTRRIVPLRLSQTDGGSRTTTATETGTGAATATERRASTEATTTTIANGVVKE